MTSKELRKKYIEFFVNRGHVEIPSASVVPENDPSVLFTTAGMHPLVPYLMGENHPAGNRLVDAQKCVRTGDIDEVGDNTHLTFFEMLGNWSLGDYFKEDSIKWSYQFLTNAEEGLGIDVARLAVSVFAGDDSAPFDEEAYKLWLELGIPEPRIAKLGKEDNWWPAGGKHPGPQGPDTEIFYWTGDEDAPVAFDPEDERWVEIWNNVFMQFNKVEATLLIDGMHTLYDSDFKINEELFAALKSLPNRKILTINGKHEEAENLLKGSGIEIYRQKESLKKDSGEYFTDLSSDMGVDLSTCAYIDHKEDNINSAKDAGVFVTKLHDESSAEWLTANSSIYEPLKQKNVDTGMGLERVVAVLQGKKSPYETDIFAGVLKVLEDLSDFMYDHEMFSINGREDKDSSHYYYSKNGPGRGDVASYMRIVADHIRTAVIMISDGVFPSNKDQGYILRRLLRRAVRNARKLGISGVEMMKPLYTAVNEALGEAYPAISEEGQKIVEALEGEAKKFERTLEKGERELNKLYEKQGSISGDDAFNLYQTFGFPFELTEEIAGELGQQVEAGSFRSAFEEHQAKSREGAAQKFAGGLVDDSEETTKLHTATHLLHEALRRVLGEHVEQKGSNINQERLRFDFSHGEKMTDEQKAEVERIVNEQIDAALPVSFELMTVEEAKERGAIGLFEDKYAQIDGGKIKVYKMGDFSFEICGGPHVENTKDLGGFKIKKEEASSAGIRRIKAILG